MQLVLALLCCELEPARLFLPSPWCKLASQTALGMPFFSACQQEMLNAMIKASRACLQRFHSLLHISNGQHASRMLDSAYAANKPPGVAGRSKADAQQAFLEEAVEGAAQCLGTHAQMRRASAESWALRWDDCLLAS
jgi:hypothetical protein